MRKIYVTFVLAFMVFVGAMAQTGSYSGTLDITSPVLNETQDNKTIEIAGSSTNYKVTIKNLTIAMLTNKDIAIDNVEIVGLDCMSLDLDCGNAYIIQSGTFPVTIDGIGTVDVIISSGTIENGILDLNLTISVTAGLQVGVDFEGALTTGIYDISADGATAVAYYSITGKKLDVEPENGIFIVKYSNGKYVKIVK